MHEEVSGNATYFADVSHLEQYLVVQETIESFNTAKKVLPGHNFAV